MGRLRFTLTNILIWVVLILSILLSENFAPFKPNPLSGFSVAPGYLLCGVLILFLAFYYFLEHKKNGLKFDVVLLPSFIAFGILMIINIFRQDTRTFVNFEGTDNFTVTFSLNDRISAALQVVIWLAILYALVFVYNRYRLNKESIRWIAKIWVVLILVLSFVDFIYEFDVIQRIFAGTYNGGGVEFLMGNANVWGLLIYSGILTAIILSYKRFHWYYFACMSVLFSYLIFTTSATAIYISLASIFAYVLFEIFTRFKTDKKVAVSGLIILGSIVSFIVLLFVIMSALKVPMFVNFLNFVSVDIINKDYFTITGRTTMWKRLFELQVSNPMDLIFGLGHVTGRTILRTYLNFTVKSAHNGFMEILFRYGLIGLAVYLAFLGLTVFAFIKHIKKKNYRFAYIYGLAFLAVLAHSMAESTTIFTPNIGGLFFGFIFVLPVLNIIQEKHFTALKEDVLAYTPNKRWDYKKAFKAIFFITVLGIVSAKIVHIIFDMDLFCNILLALTIIFTCCFILVLINYKPYNRFNDYLIISLQKHIRRDLENEK